MLLPHVQFTVRRLMIGVAGVAALLSVPSCLVWLEDSTYYAEGYSIDRFMSIRHGMDEAEVRRILGEPLKVEAVTESIEWIYGPSHLRVSDQVLPYTLQDPVRSEEPSSYTILIADAKGEITFNAGSYLGVNDESLVGANLAEMGARFGPPLKVLHETARRYMIYSDTTNSGSYQVRKIGIDHANKVNNIVAGWYWD
jgi:hypothetical protein